MVKSTLGPRSITDTARSIYAASKGTRQAWEPTIGNKSPIVCDLVEAGYLRRVKMRCGFEAFGEVGIMWTEAAHEAFGGGNASG